jgi:hypothetical protein
MVHHSALYNDREFAFAFTRIGLPVAPAGISGAMKHINYWRHSTMPFLFPPESPDS